jgi:hypothetical protein
MTPALEIEAQVAEGWHVALEVNGLRLSDDNIGTRQHNHQSRTEALGSMFGLVPTLSGSRGASGWTGGLLR